MRDQESLEQNAERLGSEVEALIKQEKLSPQALMAYLYRKNEVDKIDLACNSFGYNACTVSNGIVISLDRKDGGPSLCLGSKVQLVVIGGRVRGPNGMLFNGTEEGIITQFSTIEPANPTGEHLIFVRLNSGVLAQVYACSVALK